MLAKVIKPFVLRSNDPNEFGRYDTGEYITLREDLMLPLEREGKVEILNPKPGQNEKE